MSAGLALRCRVLAARFFQAAGWAGMAGTGLMLVALVWLAFARLSHRLPVEEAGVAIRPASSSEASPTSMVAAISLPNRSELSLVLAHIHRTAVRNGLGWPAAEYKVTVATEASPATLEVRCRLKGDYPNLRSAIAHLLRSIPGLTLRDLSMTRTSSDTSEVEAKLTFVVFLRDEPSVAVQAVQAGTP